MEKAYATIFIYPDGTFTVSRFNGLILQLEILKATSIGDVVFFGPIEGSINVEVTYGYDEINSVYYVKSIIEVKE